MKLKVQSAKAAESAGFTALEALMAAGAMGFLLLVGYTVAVKTFGATNESLVRVTDDMLADLSLRGLNAQLRKSHLDREQVANCPGHRLLQKPDSTNSSSILLQKEGDDLSFAFTERTFIAATHRSIPNAVKVIDVSSFQKNDLVYLKSLNGDSLKGFFSVANVNSTDSTLELSASPPAANDFPCSINPSAMGTLKILDPMKPLKFSLELLRIAYYKVDESNNPGSMSLFVQKWPLTGTTAPPSLVIDHFQKMKVDQQFIPSTAGKGEFKIAIDTEFGAAETKIRRTLASGYTISGLEITNQRAVPQPPMLDDLFVTCGFRTMLLMDEFVFSGSTEKIPVYRIEANYSEAETLSGSRLPSVTATLTTNGNTNPQFSAQCWSEDEVLLPSTSNVAVPTLPKKSSSSSLSFATDNTGSGLKAIYCYNPLNSTLTGNLTYMSITQKEVRSRTISCTPVNLEATTTRKWKYDEGGPTSCYRKTGVIKVGRLVDSREPTRAGPFLYTTADSCTWTNSTLKTCDSSVVLASNPKAELASVDLHPNWVLIEGIQNPLKVTCE